MQIRLNEDTIQDVVQAADLLLLTDLKTLCCEFLEGCIAAENCIGIRDFALHYCLHHVHYLATEYLETHFRDVSSTEEFLELSPQKLKEVISLEKLNVGNERYVFEAVIRWIAHDTEIRKVPVVYHRVSLYVFLTSFLLFIYLFLSQITDVLSFSFNLKDLESCDLKDTCEASSHRIMKAGVGFSDQSAKARFNS